MTKIEKINTIIFVVLAIFSILTGIAVLLGAFWHTVTFAFCFASARFYWSDNQFAASPRLYFFRTFLRFKRSRKDRRKIYQKELIIEN